MRTKHESAKDIAVLRAEPGNDAYSLRQREREVKCSVSCGFEHLLLPTMDKAPVEEPRFGHYRFAGEQRGFNHVPLGAHPRMMRITGIEERGQGACADNDLAVHLPKPSMHCLFGSMCAGPSWLPPRSAPKSSADLSRTASCSLRNVSMASGSSPVCSRPWGG